MRTLIDYAPFDDNTHSLTDRGHWPAKWITHPAADGRGPLVQAFRCTFNIDRARTVRIHVSADERYELFLDGVRIGRGPERGDRINWFFETYDLPLGTGRHTLVARTWWLGQLAPFAQMTVRPAFVVAAEQEDTKLLNTGNATWTVKMLGGYEHVRDTAFLGSTGSRVRIIGRDVAWGFERGEGDGWVEPHPVDTAIGPNLFGDQPLIWILRPAMLPAMIERAVHVGRARHVQPVVEIPGGENVVRSSDHLSTEADDWNALLAGQKPILIPPRTSRRVIIDLENYYCAYPDLVTSGGGGAVVRIHWAESLFLPKDPKGAADQPRTKGNRDEIEGKVFLGGGGTFEPDGGEHRAFTTLWWEAGRYLELVVTTADQPLTIDELSLRETHFPHDWKSEFNTDDPRFADLTPITRRVMEMCSHETYMDCPYYEQLMYIGDSRLEVLTTYACTPDDRLPRKALRMMDDSRCWPGFTQSRYPARVPQIIPPFSAWWVAMVHDYAMWRDDPAYVRSLLPGVRAVLDTFMGFATKDGLIAGPTGWNFADWVPGWVWGMPPDGDTGGLNATLNFQLAWILQQAAELEEHFGEAEIATLQRRRASTIANATAQVFWNEDRGLFADDRKQQHFSEHTQCLALLGNTIDAHRRARLIDHLFTDDKLDRTTVYFSHYLFETCALTGRLESMFERLKLWFDLKAQGFKTTLESPEPSRSDSHAWGAHPMYHYYATLLGIRPAAPGFANVVIRPQLGPLQWAKGSMTHPKGAIEVDVRQTNGRLSGTVSVPAGVNGTVLANGTTYSIQTTSVTFE